MLKEEMEGSGEAITDTEKLSDVELDNVSAGAGPLPSPPADVPGPAPVVSPPNDAQQALQQMQQQAQQAMQDAQQAQKDIQALTQQPQ